MTETFAQAIGDLAAHKQYVLVGDGHSLPVIANTFFSRDVYDSLKAAGVRHFFLEVPREKQADYNSYSDGKIGREQFVGGMMESLQSSTMDDATKRNLLERQADLLEWAKQDGIQVHCADHRYGMFQKMEHDPVVMADYKKNAHAKVISGELESLTEYLDSKRDQVMPDGSKTSLLRDDRPLGAFIQQHVKGHEKAAIFYGADHQTNSYGIDEILGQEKVGRVAVYAYQGDKLERAVWSAIADYAIPSYPDPYDLVYRTYDDKAVEWPKGHPSETASVTMDALSASQRSLSSEAQSTHGVRPARLDHKPAP